MKCLKMLRNLRRLVTKRKGGLRKTLIWLIILALAVYFLIVFFTQPGDRQIWDARGLWNISGSKCGMKCPVGQVAFYIKSGQGTAVGPTICYEDMVLISPEKKNFQRGINAVIINDRTREVMDIKNFDTYHEENPMIKYLKTNVHNNSIIMIASYDEMSDSLKEDGRRWLKLFGSALIDRLKFRDTFIMIGQRGLVQGYAVEYFKSKFNKDFADSIEKSGCFGIPMGPISNFDLRQMLPRIKQGKDLKIGPDYPNCGMAVPCDKDRFPVMLYTGKESKIIPQICVNGKMMMDKGLNNAGRGFNLMIVDPETTQTTMISRFDTYGEDSTNLEIFLETLKDGDIVLATVHDDASKKLSFFSKEMINNLGSSMLQNLRFRDVWVFVGQKGINGFTNMEQISYAGYNAEWPKPLKQFYCVPKKIVGSKIVPDPLVFRNDGKRSFCVKYDGYADFCAVDHVDRKIVSAPIILTALKDQKIFKTPIIIIPGLNHNSLVRTAESVMMQPGIDPAHVVMMWDEKFPEYAELANLFGFLNHSLPSSIKYSDIMIKAIEGAWTIFPESEEVIVLEEELLLAPDFLHFMAQTQLIMTKDTTLFGVSAWNYNGYDTTSGKQNALYRVEQFPGLGFMLKKDVYIKKMRGKMETCCSKRAWDDWWSELENPGDILVPDVSRVYREPYHASLPDQDYLLEIFNRERKTNLEGLFHLNNDHNLATDKYNQLIGQLLKNSSYVDHTELRKCINNTDSVFTIPKTSRQSMSLYFEQMKVGDYSVLISLCRCFGLYSYGNQRPKNLYRGMLRFYYQDHDMFLVGSKSIFYSYKPQNVEPFVYAKSAENNPILS